MQADICLLDENGETVAELEGLHFKQLDGPLLAAGGGTGSRYADWLYEVRWE